jgi:NADH:ubiquinone oxidoreductase subunit 4 (subunit M)
MFGPVKEPEHGSDHPVTDLNLREVTILAPIAALCLALGVYPQPVLNTIEPDVRAIADIADRARSRAESGLTAMPDQRAKAEPAQIAER